MINIPLVLLVLLSLTSLDTTQVFSALIFSCVWVASGSIAAYAPPLIKVLRVACAQISLVNVGCVYGLYAPSQALADQFTVH